MRDIVGLVGLALVSVGAWQAWEPMGLIVPGVLLLTASVVGHLRQPRR